MCALVSNLQAAALLISFQALSLKRKRSTNTNACVLRGLLEGMPMWELKKRRFA